ACVAKERLRTGGGVVADYVITKRFKADGRIVATCRVIIQRIAPNGRVLAAGYAVHDGVVKERLLTDARVAIAVYVVIERGAPHSRVLRARRITEECVRTNGRVAEAIVLIKGIKTIGRVLEGACVAIERLRTGGRVGAAA